MNHIKSIHGTSVGSILAVILAIKEEWWIIEKYFIERPWLEIFDFKLSNVIKSIKTCGIFDNQCIIKCLRPIFSAHDLDIEKITMKELYDYSGIDIYIYSVNSYLFEVESFSWKTHPDWRVLDVMYISSSIPFIFQPFRHPVTNHIYIDGGICMNYPIIPCIKSVIEKGDKLNSILGIQLNLNGGCSQILNESIEQNMNLLEYMYFIFSKIIWKLTDTDYCYDTCLDKTRPYEIFMEMTKHGTDVMSILKYKEMRKDFVDYGKKIAKDFLETAQKTL